MKSEKLLDKKKELKRMELETNVFRMETSLLELDEEKEKLQQNIEEQKARLESGDY